MDRVLALYRLTHGPEGPAGLLEALRSTAPFVERGRRSARVFREADDSGSLLLMEEWDTPEDLARHIRTPSFRRLLAVLELSGTPPEIVYVRGSSVRGMDWIAEVLGTDGLSRRQ
jgi:quinol monooxygenase YgiN